MSTCRIHAMEDPILARPHLPYSATFYPFGFPLLVSANVERVLDAAEESWSCYQRAFYTEALLFDCYVEAGGGLDAERVPRLRARRNTLVSVIDPNNFAYADLEHGHAMAWVTSAVTRDISYFRYHVLEAMVLSMLDAKYLPTIHAACVERNGHGVLLAGESGAGKTSLAYACARNGWTYVADDSSSIVLESDGRLIIGTPARLRFRGSAGALFPEFEGWKESQRANGKPTIEVLTSLLPGIRTAPRAHADFIVFLNRSKNAAQPATIHEMSRHEAGDRLFMTTWPPELSGAGKRYETFQRLLVAETFALNYSTLEEAIALLESLTEVPTETGAGF